MAVSWVVFIVGFVVVVERIEVLVVFGFSFVIVVEFSLCIVGFKGGKGVFIGIMICIFINGIVRFGLFGKFYKVGYYVFFN